MGGVATIVGPEVASATVCRFCGAPFVGIYRAQYTCAQEACVAERVRAYERERMRDPSRVLASRARSREWAREHRGCHRSEPWLLGQPAHGSHLPGGGCEIFVAPAPKWPVEHRNVRALHGAITALLDHGHDEGEPGRGRWPEWALIPWPRGTLGWGVYWRTEAGAALACTTRDGRLYDRACAFRFGPLVRVKAPEIATRGRRRIAIDAVTPVSIQSADRTIERTSPDATSLISALSHGFGRRCGLLEDVPTSDLRIEVVSDETRIETVKLGAYASAKYGHVRGWVGRVVVECNAPAHWLLECAARCVGLGGRTAFGFGRVRVAPC